MRKNEIKKKNISANALSDDDLEDVAGGKIHFIRGIKSFPNGRQICDDAYLLELIAPDGTTYKKKFDSRDIAEAVSGELLKLGYTQPE